MRLGDIGPGLHLVWEEEPTLETRNELSRRIDAFNALMVPFAFERIALLLRDDAGSMHGGLSSVIYWNWMFIDNLWIEDSLRGRGIGTRLMNYAEQQAVAKGCHSAWLDTFQARGFYEKLGYVVFGVLDEYPLGQQRTFLKKRLVA